MNTMNKKSIVICLALAVAAWSLPVQASNYSTAVINAAPVAFWQFNDASSSDGSTCADTMGNHNAIYRNKGAPYAGIPDISLGPGQVGNAATFNGTSSGNGNFIDIPGGNTSGLEFTSGTLEFWLNALPGPYNRVMQHNDGMGDPYGWGCMVVLNNPNQIGIFGCDSTWYTPSSDHPLEDNNWHYIVVTYSYDGVGTTTETWYNDSTLEASRTVSGSLTYPTSWADPVIGAEGGNPIYIWHGYTGALADVAIYNYALSPAQITAHYNAAIPEPATIALLSLGGLALLKRRAHA